MLYVCQNRWIFAICIDMRALLFYSYAATANQGFLPETPHLRHALHMSTTDPRRDVLLQKHAHTDALHHDILNTTKQAHKKSHTATAWKSCCSLSLPWRPCRAVTAKYTRPPWSAIFSAPCAKLSMPFLEGLLGCLASRCSCLVSVFLLKGLHPQETAFACVDTGAHG